MQKIRIMILILLTGLFFQKGISQNYDHNWKVVKKPADSSLRDFELFYNSNNSILQFQPDVAGNYEIVLEIKKQSEMIFNKKYNFNIQEYQVYNIVKINCNYSEIEFEYKKEKKNNYSQNSPSYKLAKKLSEKIKILDPEVNTILISTKYFDITSDETIISIINNFGTRANQLIDMDVNIVKDIIKKNAEDLAIKQLLENQADNKKIVVSDMKVDSIMELQYKQFGGEEKFTTHLKSNNINLETVKESIISGIKINELLDKVLDKNISMNEMEILAEYKEETGQRRVQHILIKTDSNSTDAIKVNSLDKINDLLAKIKRGEDFGKLAKEHSDCPSATKGGDLGLFGKGTMVPPFDKAVFSMKVGEISEVVETSFGYHIIKLNEIEKNKPFEEMKEQLTETAKNKKKAELFNIYIKKIKLEANFIIIEI